MKLPKPPPARREPLRSAADDAGLASPVDPKGRYLHYDDVRNRPAPKGLTTDEWWASLRQARDVLARPLPLTAVDGRPFVFCNVDPVQRAVHEVDRQAGGQFGAKGALTVEQMGGLVSALTDEAISSSQLEGAAVTRGTARRLLASGERPRDHSELMVLNNYRALVLARDMVGSPMTPGRILELHRAVTAGTLDDPAGAGRLQTVDDDRIGVYANDDTLVHEPPPADELPARLDALCAFANGETGDGFLHPVVRAIIVHFMLAYDHPFSDGNGRTARALFYWSMLDSGYWLVEYVTISELLNDAPVKYVRSFLLTETDSNDVTYFVLHQLSILLRAIDALGRALGEKMARDAS